jgi:hypothetical protein
MRVPRLIGLGLAFSFLATLVFIELEIHQANSSGLSPYQSGYNHGCSDSRISNPSDRYINQPEKGPSFHTDEFMDGYDDGYVECSDGSNSDNSGSNGDLADWNDNCRDAGYEDGQNGPFNQPTYDHCGDEEGGDVSYYKGFIEGCMDADNTRDVCESTTDAGE